MRRQVIPLQEDTRDSLCLIAISGNPGIGTGAFGQQAGADANTIGVTRRLQILSALIAFTHAQSRHKIAKTAEANRLGRALRGIRAEIGLKQYELAKAS